MVIDEIGVLKNRIDGLCARDEILEVIDQILEHNLGGIQERSEIQQR